MGNFAFVINDTATSTSATVPRAADATAHRSPSEYGGRLALGAVVAAALGMLGASSIVGAPSAGLLLIIAILIGPGCAVTSFFQRLPMPLLLALVPSLGLATATGIGALMILNPTIWEPVAAGWVVLALTALAGLVSLVRWRATPLFGSVRSLRISTEVPLAWALYAVGLILWILSQTVITGRPVGDYGLLAANPLIAVAIVLVALGLCFAAMRNDSATMAVGILLTILCIRVTPVLAAPAPTPFYAYQHLAVVDLFLQTGQTHPNVDIYSNWPGMFAAFAWLGAFEAIDPLVAARWFPVAIHVLLACGIFAMGHSLRLTPRATFLAMFAVELLNWVGQDYYSPQAIALVMATAVLALLLDPSRQATMWLAVPIFSAIVVTHQLTPVWMAMVIWGLTILRVVRLPLAITMTAILGVWVGLNMEAISPFGMFSGFSLTNAQSNVPTEGVPGRQFAQTVSRLASVALWGPACISLAWLLLRRRRGVIVDEEFRSDSSTRRDPIILIKDALGRRRVLALGGLAFSPFVILAAQSYGGEAIFRVFLYSLLGGGLLIGILADRLMPNVARRSAGRKSFLREGTDVTPRRPAAGRTPAQVRGYSVPGVVVSVVAFLTMSLVGSQALMGTWIVQRVSLEGVAASTALTTQLPAPATMVEVAPSLPTAMSADYIKYATAGRNAMHALVIRDYFRDLEFHTQADLDQLDYVFGPQANGLYLVFSPEGRNYVRFYGLIPLEDYDRFHTLIDESPEWRRVGDFPEDLGVYEWMDAPTP